MINVTKQRLKYIVADYLSTALALALFSVARYFMIDSINEVYHGFVNFLRSQGVIQGLIYFPPLMMLIYYLAGIYDNVIQRSRLHEMVSTFTTSCIGALIYFFGALLNDYIPQTRMSYEMILLLVLLLFICVYTCRAIITRYTTRKVHSGEWGFNTLIVGTSEAARKLAVDLKTRYRSMGLKVVGYVNTIDGFTPRDGLDLPVYELDTLDTVVVEQNIQKLIITPNRHGRRATVDIINRLFPLDLSMFITPDLYNLMTMRPRMSNVAALPLIDISRCDMPPSTLNIKRLSDVVVSVIALILLSPILAAIAVMIKLDSPGPVFYKQTRIGYHKRPFDIIKFRTMIPEAEAAGPALSTDNDPRITRIGRVLRKYRLDELPNFWNVVRGDMSLVGPRPEREFYIKQITERAPYYTMIHQVRPGITSWGMVQYGYANTVDGMIERLKYDLIYIENVSFLVDIKILIYTIRTVVTGRGM
ncbi:MAG: sugar transferase [Muribaculaceae bacterium]|nr:sugar transferase [Muribaculaceae bacterium]